VDNLGLVVSIVTGLIIAKLLAALVAQKAYGYSREEGFTMWSLFLPQVAATLAATLVAYSAKNPEGRGLIDAPLLNSIIVLMVVTSVLGPVLTEFFGKQLVKT
jgi:Kef-type K+ transport system membrane component KefB